MKLHKQIEIKDHSYKGKQVNSCFSHLFLAYFQPLLENVNRRWIYIFIERAFIDIFILSKAWQQKPSWQTNMLLDQHISSVTWISFWLSPEILEWSYSDGTFHGNTCMLTKLWIMILLVGALKMLLSSIKIKLN